MSTGSASPAAPAQAKLGAAGTAKQDCMLCRQTGARNALALNPEKVDELDRLYPDLLREVVRPHWLNANPKKGQLYLYVCGECSWTDRTGRESGPAAAGGASAAAAAPTQATGSDNDSDNDDELCAAIAESLKQTEISDEETSVAQAMAASLTSEAAREKGGDSDEDFQRALAESLQEASSSKGLEGESDDGKPSTTEGQSPGADSDASWELTGRCGASGAAPMEEAGRAGRRMIDFGTGGRLPTVEEVHPGEDSDSSWELAGGCDSSRATPAAKEGWIGLAGASEGTDSDLGSRLGRTGNAIGRANLAATWPLTEDESPRPAARTMKKDTRGGHAGKAAGSRTSGVSAQAAAGDSPRALPRSHPAQPSEVCDICGIWIPWEPTPLLVWCGGCNTTDARHHEECCRVRQGRRRTERGRALLRAKPAAARPATTRVREALGLDDQSSCLNLGAARLTCASSSDWQLGDPEAAIRRALNKARAREAAGPAQGPCRRQMTAAGGGRLDEAQPPDPRRQRLRQARVDRSRKTSEAPPAAQHGGAGNLEVV